MGSGIGASNLGYRKIASNRGVSKILHLRIIDTATVVFEKQIEMSITTHPSNSQSPAMAARLVADTNPACYVFENVHHMATHVAQMVAAVIRERNALGQNAVLGLPSGSTPMSVYRELIRMHKDEGLDFSQVTTFNLDEYYGIEPTSLQSYHRWMNDQFFDHININRDQVHIPDGTTPLDQIEEHCLRYEEKINLAGGLDIVLLGIGTNGHIGFNEPFSASNSRTRLCTLDPITRRTAASDFFGVHNVPNQAITMGMATILEARKVILMALGEHKSSIIQKAVEGPVSDLIPASFLKEHGDAKIFLDNASSKDLKLEQTPWTHQQGKWDSVMIKRALLWLCDQTGKALLKLDDDDFREHNLHHLLRHHGPAEEVSHRVFRWMTETIEYHPGGRSRKKVICFSPHPDDDVISMGGSLIRLNEDGHEVHVAYMTSGNIAVFDHDARRVADMVTEYNRLFGIDKDNSEAVEKKVNESFKNKQPGQPDIEDVRKIKALIRWSEAKEGAMIAGCEESNCHFLDLPFYRTGMVDKLPWGPDDADIIERLILEIQPEQIYVAGDLSDPHGTHRVCAEAIFHVLRKIEQEQGSRPEVLLYRGAWQEYELHEIDIAVPLSPSDMKRKQKAIFMHESQKDEALFPGADPREFWERAVDRNTGTANKFNLIGLPEYYAMEAFVRWDGAEI